VVWVEFRVAVVSPVGATVVPFEVDVVPVTTPLTEVDFSLWVSTDAAGGGVTGVVVVCVVVELDEEDCAKAPPVIRAMAIAAASACLIMLNFHGSRQAGIARLVAIISEIDRLATGSESTQSWPLPYRRQPLSSPRSE
jgi:hypothetical protein